MEKVESVTFFDAGTKVELIRKKIYIIGPMRGIKYFNFPAFDKIRDELASDDWDVISPADLDRIVGFDGCKMPDDTDWRIVPEGFNMDACIDRDVMAILSLRQGSDAVFVLPGKLGIGSSAELKLAIWKKLDIIFSKDVTCGDSGIFGDEEERKKLEASKDQPAAVLDEAKSLVCGDRNASYGPPNQDFKRTADMWTALLQFKLRDGESLRPQDVAAMMICLKMSRAQHSKKRDNWVDTAGYAACGWRCEAGQ
jgi:hypothetical protein